jgi:hypothetical protein
LQLVGHVIERDAESCDLVIAGDRCAAVRSPAAMRSAAPRALDRTHDFAQRRLHGRESEERDDPRNRQPVDIIEDVSRSSAEPPRDLRLPRRMICCASATIAADVDSTSSGGGAGSSMIERNAAMRARSVPRSMRCRESSVRSCWTSR